MSAKVAFSKLGLKKKDEIKTFTFNGQEIEVKQYLPTEEKINIITNVLQNSADDNNFANPMKVEVYGNLEILYAYTNINITDKQKEDAAKLYDLFEENGLFNEIIDHIPDKEYSLLLSWMNETIKSFYNYRNSIMGILEQVSTDYSNLDLDATEIQKKIADPENLALLKDVLTKLG